MCAKNREAVQLIKERLSLADLARRYIELRNVGSRLVAPCPFHQETKPSFSINEEQGTFYCFGCQASGDIFDFYGRLNGLDFKDSLEQLAEEAGVRLSEYRSNDAPYQPERSQKSYMLKMHELAANHFAANLKPAAGEACKNYLNERGISKELSENFRLGWSLPQWQPLHDTITRAGFKIDTAVSCGLLAKNGAGRTYDRFRGRLMFPIFNLAGQIVAFGGRILPALAGPEDAKYINSSDSPIYKKGEHLYGLFQARKSIAVKKNIILTEGYVDVITLHQFGYTEAAGVLGTALTPDQVKRLSGFSSRIELLFDGDKPGRNAALRACEMLLSRGLTCKVVLLPEGEDIDSLLRTQSVEVFEQLRATAPDGLDFCMDCLRALSLKERVEWVRNFLGLVDLPELFSYFASQFASQLSLSESELRGGIADRSVQNAAVAAQSVFTGKPAAISLDKQIMSFAIRYPHRLETLRQLGADLTLSDPWALKLWNKLETGHDNIFSVLDEKEKLFWVRCRDRGVDAPELNNECGELDAIKNMLETMETSSLQDSVAAALRRQATDYDTQRDFLRALKEARGRHGDH